MAYVFLYTLGMRLSVKNAPPGTDDTSHSDVSSSPRLLSTVYQLCPAR